MTAGALLLAGHLAWQAAPPPAVTTEALSEAYVLFIQGRELESGGDVDGALAAYRRALTLVPSAAEVHAEMSALFARQNRADLAVSEALAALKIEPANRQAHRILGFVQAAMADQTLDAARQSALVAEAIGHFEQALAGPGRDPGVQFSLGRLYVRSEKYDKGIETLRLFLLDQPGYPDAMMALAEAYEATHQPAQAIDLLEDLTQEHPDQTRAVLWLADLYEQAGRWKDAAGAWGTLAVLAPRNVTYRLRRAMALANGGDVANGRQMLTEITKDSPREISAWYLLSQVERKAGNAAAAEEAAKRIAEIDPKDPRGPLALAEARTAAGNFRGAADILDPLVRAPRDEDVADGTYARLAQDQATALQQAGDAAGALDVLERARKRAPGDRTLLYALATAYERAKRLDQAETLVRAVLTGDPKDGVALNYLGYLLADHNRKLDEAVDLVQRALVLEPGNPSYLDSLGWAYFRQAKWDLARPPLEQAAAALPQNSVILDHLGELYFQLKRYREAAGVWDRALAGDRRDIDVDAVTKKRDRAKALAGK